MHFDYYEEAKRIWAMTEEDFIDEYNVTAKGFCSGPVNISYIELLEIKAHHTWPQYYTKLKDVLFEMVFTKLLTTDPEGMEALFDGLVILNKLHSYVLHLSKLQIPASPQFFEANLDFIEGKITIFEKMM